MNNTTRIQLYGNVSGFLDVAPNTAFPLNFGIADIRDVSQRSGTFSKSITLTGNKNNNKLLNNYFDVNIVAGTFDINKLTTCAVIQNGIVILDNATIQLISINNKQLNGGYEDFVSYTVIIKDSTTDFFKEINNKLLTDLDFSDLNHTYTANNVIDSFDNTISDGYKYLMPHNPGTSADTKFYLNEFTPAIYTKKYFDNIFAKSGFGYSWPSMSADTLQFDKLIIPYNGEAPSIKDSGDDYLTIVKNNVISEFQNLLTYPGYNITIPKRKIKINEIVKDINNYYDEVNSKYVSDIVSVLPNGLNYSIDIEWELDLYNYGSVDSVLSRGSFNYLPTLYLVDSGDNIKDSSTSLYNYSNSGYTSNFKSDTLTLKYGSKRYTSGSNVVGGGNTTINLKAGVTIGDALTLQMDCQVVGQDGPKGSAHNQGADTSAIWYEYNNSKVIETRPVIRIKNINVKIEPALTTLSYSYPVKINNFIPKQIKQSDFIKSIFTMYNLFAEVDKDNPKLLNISHRDEYYDAGVAKDWTKKIAKDKDQDLRFLPELQTKKVVLTYREDKDPANTTYLQATSEIFGQQEYEFDNEYVRDKTKQEIIFSPSPMFNEDFGAVLPIVNGQAPKTNPRILFDGGEYSCGEYSIENYSGNTVSGTTYPHLSHWNKPFNPTLDLNFGVCDFYFRSDDYGTNTSNNLFNLYWRRTMNQINTGKLLSAYFSLNESDIQSLKLNDKIRIDNSWWNINKIIDYDANSNTLTKVELISVDDTLKIPFKTKVTKKYKREYPIFNPVRNKYWNDNNYKNTFFTNHNVSVIGTGNYFKTEVQNAYVGGNNNWLQQSATIQGDNNIVQTRSAVFGSNNIVQSFAENSLVVGTNITATRPETIYTKYIEVLDSIYLPNAVISANGEITVTNYIIDGGLNEVMNIAKTNLIDILDGSFNSVRNFGGDSKARPIIDGGIN